MRIEDLRERMLDAALARHNFGYEVEARRSARTGELYLLADLLLAVSRSTSEAS